MNTSVKKKWIAALTKGEYKQGKRVLKHKDTYCCLGVLCDLHSQEHTNKWKEGTKQEPEDCSTYIGCVFTLPDKVMKWAGLEDESPEIIFDGESTTLAELNDEDKTFKEIAQLIKDQL